jgi:hypothetical protein
MGDFINKITPEPLIKLFAPETEQGKKAVLAYASLYAAIVIISIIVMIYKIIFSEGFKSKKKPKPVASAPVASAPVAPAPVVSAPVAKPPINPEPVAQTRAPVAPTPVAKTPINPNSSNTSLYFRQYPGSTPEYPTQSVGMYSHDALYNSLDDH